LGKWRGGWANINQISLSKVFKGKIHKSSLLGSRTPAFGRSSSIGGARRRDLKRGPAFSFLKKKKITKYNQYLLKLLQAFEELTFLKLVLIFLFYSLFTK